MGATCNLASNDATCNRISTDGTSNDYFDFAENVTLSQSLSSSAV